MLNVIFSHWMTYVYGAYVLILVLLCIAYRPQTSPLYWKLRQLRFRDRVRFVTPLMRRRQVR